MRTIERITPVLARTVLAFAIITCIAGGVAAYIFSEPRLVSFAAFAFIAGAYARKVIWDSSPVTAPTEINQTIHPLAA